jgi:hypothetical protein
MSTFYFNNIHFIKPAAYSTNFLTPVSHLICTLISENEGLEKLRSASNLRKISVPADLILFS